ncbi:hypothetical protein QAD02_014179 [Eretmocerus hayati]|uniref:Uncharacterized protein n=1 Tax=Eretmocerus hayati TaxID=131215 RepID=A0ACC2P4T6_9HYME|nr:hypothetical protein QAD02_014179 [Eretmocerus hayati]
MRIIQKLCNLGKCSPPGLRTQRNSLPKLMKKLEEPAPKKRRRSKELQTEPGILENLEKLKTLINYYDDLKTLMGVAKDDLFKDKEDGLGFLIIPFVLKLLNLKSNGPDAAWRPSVADTALSFIVHAKMIYRF